VKVAVRPPSSTKSTLTGIWRIFEPKLVEDFVHSDTARAAYIVGMFGAIAALMQFVFSPVLGAFPITTDAVRWCCFRTSG
jgi:MFS-type transporter involved in bile tolerance (Atg22 family)